MKVWKELVAVAVRTRDDQRIHALVLQLADAQNTKYPRAASHRGMEAAQGKEWRRRSNGMGLMAGGIGEMRLLGRGIARHCDCGGIPT